MNELELWLRYFTFWSGLPRSGDPRRADCIIVQAFGRNMYTDASLHIVRGLWAEACDESDALAVARLRERHFDAGEPNRSLAQACSDLINHYDLPAIVQWEIATAFDPLWYEKHEQKIFCLWPPRKGYFPTTRVTEDALAVMRKAGWRRPILLTHRRQIARAYCILRKQLGYNPVVFPEMPAEFDHRSVQFWTQSPLHWLPREALGRIHHLLLRYV